MRQWKTAIRRRHGRRLTAEQFEPRQMLATDLLITEFVADNDGSLLDGEGESSDWIEIFNAGDASVDLSGWALTDDAQRQDKWPFPSGTLEAGQYLTVFASGNNETDVAGNLHTNFRLRSAGEYLALTRPDSTVAQEFAPAYPSQRSDTSFGAAMSSEFASLIDVGSTVRAIVPTDAMDNAWRTNTFDDSPWLRSQGDAIGVGYSLAPPRPAGLVAEWMFETSRGTAVADGQLAVGDVDESSGHENGPLTGQGLGDAPVDVIGLSYTDDTPEFAGVASNFALSFPATENPTNHVRVPVLPNSPLAQMTVGDFRVETWFKTTDTGRSILVGSYAGPANSLNLELHTANRGRIYVQGPNGTTDLNLRLPTDSRDGNWHHLAGVRDGDQVELFYDGTRVGGTNDLAGDFVLEKPFVYLGRDAREEGVLYRGLLDDVRFYNSSDSAELIAAYDFERAQGQSVEAGQMATGPIDDASGTEVPQHGIGSSIGDDNQPPGINYVYDVPAQISNSIAALAFDQNNSNVEHVDLGMPASVAELTQGDFTVQTWFQSTDTGRSILMGSYTGPDNALNLELHTDNRLRIYIQNANGGTTDLNVSVSDVGNSRDGQWHFATAVRRGSIVELYFDGILVGQTTDVAGSFTQTGSHFYFGRDRRVDATRFDGQLDEVRFWNIALEAEQILAMARGATPTEATSGFLDHLIGIDLADRMPGQNSSALIRIPFDVADPQRLTALELDMQFNDGFVAFINGQRVAGENAPDPLEWNAAALTDRDVALANDANRVVIGNPRQRLVAGRNMLAIHGLNADPLDVLFLIVPNLTSVATTVDVDDHRFFLTPTPGTANVDGVVAFVEQPVFSVPHGLYDASDLEPGGVLSEGMALSTSTPGAVIRYTLDGTWPSATQGHIYDGPIQMTTTTTIRAVAVRDRYAASNTTTHSYLILDDIVRQPADPGANAPGTPTYPRPFPRTHQPGVPADYEMDPEVVDDPLYRDTIKEDLKSIPTMSLVMDMDDIFNQPHGIWSNSQQRGDAWERRTSVEYFDPQDPTREFQVNAAIRIQGRASRVPSSSIKHSFRLIFKDDYGPVGQKQPTGGPQKLEFPLFPDSAVERFDNLILRAGYNYSYLHGANDQNIRAQYIRERFMRESQLATGQLASQGSYVHLYINGLYFGLYAPQERIDGSFLAEHFGGDEDSYDVISAGQVRDGTPDAWNELLSLADEDLSLPANYQAVTRMLDVDNLIDYMIVHIWGGTTDWPAPGGQLRNWIAVRERAPEGQFKFFVWDAEYSIQNVRDNRVRVGDALTPAFLYRQLQDNASFRLRFADRVHLHLFGDGALTPHNNIARYQRLADEIDRAIVAESARWGDTRADGCNPCRRDPHWVNERDWVLRNYLPTRTSLVLEQFRDVGLYPEFDAPGFSVPSGNVAWGTSVDMTSPSTDRFFESRLITPESRAKMLIPRDDHLGTQWTETEFIPDDMWLDGKSGVGYERGTGYESLINNDIETHLYNQGTSAYIRIPFEWDGRMQFDHLDLNLWYDDGFIAYLNGQEIARSISVSVANATFDSRATNHRARAAETFRIELESAADLLRHGTNVLAIHGLNRSPSNSDFLISPELIGKRRDVMPSLRPIWYTTDGSDPRSEDGSLSAVAIQYDGRPLILARSQDIHARVLRDQQWSALSHASYVMDGAGRGDLDQNGHINIIDLDLLSAALRADQQQSRFDINQDGTVGTSDREALMRDILGTDYGDANFDGRFDFDDLLFVQQAGEYDDAIFGNSTWAEGDWNGDGEFDSDDLLLALQTGAYQISVGP